MINDFDSQTNLSQNENPSLPQAYEPPPEAPVVFSQKPTPALRLVVSNVISNAIPAPLQKSEAIQSTGFIAEIRKRSPYNFMLAARDHFHFLSCDVPLTLEESKKSKPAAVSVIAEFPAICNEALVDFIDEEEDLLGMILIQFHMQILRALLLFCLSHKARALLIRVNEHQAKELGIYEDFIKHADQAQVKDGITVRLTIPVNAKVLDQCNDLIDDIASRFRRMLWEEKSSNPPMWNYLISNRHFSIVDL